MRPLRWCSDVRRLQHGGILCYLPLALPYQNSPAAKARLGSYWDLFGERKAAVAWESYMEGSFRSGAGSEMFGARNGSQLFFSSRDLVIYKVLRCPLSVIHFRRRGGGVSSANFRSKFQDRGWAVSRPITMRHNLNSLKGDIGYYIRDYYRGY